MLVRPPIPRGVYMYGGVGRGKSFLMDCFFQAVPLKRKVRLHFHEFMREVHRELQDLKGMADPLQELGRRISLRYRLICFDEFHIADVTDAMILHRLLLSLFENRVSFVTTSNFKPDDLYPNGLNRERILPAIELLNAKLEVINVDAGTDYRQPHADRREAVPHAAGRPRPTPTWPPPSTTWPRPATRDPILHIEHREIRARRRAGGVVWFDFRQLCGGPRSMNDYLELATQFHTLMLSDVPQMPPRLSAEARRFTWLVDVLYDRRVKLVISAAVPPEELYPERPAGARVPAHDLAAARDAVAGVPGDRQAGCGYRPDLTARAQAAPRAQASRARARASRRASASPARKLAPTIATIASASHAACVSAHAATSGDSCAAAPSAAVPRLTPLIATHITRDARAEPAPGRWIRRATHQPLRPSVTIIPTTNAPASSATAARPWLAAPVAAISAAWLTVSNDTANSTPTPITARRLQARSAPLNRRAAPARERRRWRLARPVARRPG